MRPRADSRLQRELPVQVAGALPSQAPGRQPVGGGADRDQPVPPPAHRPGGPDGAERDPGSRRHFGDGQGVHDRRPAQRAHRVAGEDRAGQFGVLRSP